VIAILGVIVRLRVEDSPVFRELRSRGQVVKSPVIEALRRHWRLILIGIFLVGVFNGVWYYVNYVFSLSYATTLAKEFSKPFVSNTVTDLGILIVSIIGIFASILFGYLSDVFGRRPQMIADAVFGISVLSTILPNAHQRQSNVSSSRYSELVGYSSTTWLVQ
jgi:hypothetical protein